MGVGVANELRVLFEAFDSKFGQKHIIEACRDEIEHPPTQFINVSKHLVYFLIHKLNSIYYIMPLNFLFFFGFGTMSNCQYHVKTSTQPKVKIHPQFLIYAFY